MGAHDDYDVLMEWLAYPGSARLRPVFEEMITPDQANLPLGLTWPMSILMTVMVVRYV